MKKKIYLINLHEDFGELWLDENLKFLDYVNCNDAHFRKEYQSFIIDYLGGELIISSIQVPDSLRDLLYDVMGDGEAMVKLLDKEIKKALKKVKNK